MNFYETVLNKKYLEIHYWKKNVWGDKKKTRSCFLDYIIFRDLAIVYSMLICFQTKHKSKIFLAFFFRMLIKDPHKRVNSKECLEVKDSPSLFYVK